MAEPQRGLLDWEMAEWETMGTHGVGVLYRRTVNFYRSCVGLGWLAQETTGFILVRVSEE
jgi:hypothetical protein